jgi:hypothetical protein
MAYYFGAEGMAESESIKYLGYWFSKRSIEIPKKILCIVVVSGES